MIICSTAFVFCRAGRKTEHCENIAMFSKWKAHHSVGVAFHFSHPPPFLSWLRSRSVSLLTTKWKTLRLETWDLKLGQASLTSWDPQSSCP